MMSRTAILIDKALRSHPFAYGVLSACVIGLSLLVVAVVWFNAFSHSVQKDVRQIFPNENQEQRADRLVIMNALNKFHLNKSSISATSSPELRDKIKLEYIRTARQTLQSFKSDPLYDSARADLLNIFSKWERFTQEKKNTSEIADDFVALGQHYPWLNTLVTIILLNRL